MAERTPPEGGPLERQRIIDALCEHFAEDRLSVEEFEQRVDMANRASSAEDLQAALKGLPDDQSALAPTSSPPVPATSRRPPVPIPGTEGPVVVSPEVVRDRQWIVAVFSGPKRTGAWIPARRTVVTAVMGGAELDFREARLGPGVTEVTAIAWMGGVEIIVPPGLQVDCNGIGIMGAFENSEAVTPVMDPSRPILRIGGLAVFGGVEVKVRYPGESARDAKRRLKLEREERKRLGRG
jgi:hypothetical protein